MATCTSIPKHALAEQLIWDAEHNPRNVGFSHNVQARLTREADATVVEEITRVQSVDLVADPASTQGLFEQSGRNGDDLGGRNVPWDALTVDTLRLHRPDLLEGLKTDREGDSELQLQEAQGRVKTLQRRQHVVDLLCEHGLSCALRKIEKQGSHWPGRSNGEYVVFRDVTEFEG